MKLYKEDKPKFYKLLMFFWIAVLIFGFIRGWSMLSKLMCASLAMSAFLFIGTSKKEAAWVEKYGDPDEYERMMNEKEEAAKAKRLAEAEDAEALEGNAPVADDEVLKADSVDAEMDTPEDASADAEAETPAESNTDTEATNSLDAETVAPAEEAEK